MTSLFPWVDFHKGPNQAGSNHSMSLEIGRCSRQPQNVFFFFRLLSTVAVSLYYYGRSITEEIQL